MQRLFYVFLLIMSVTNVFAQQKARGIVRDNETNQPIPLATVLYNNQKIICNNNGGFEIIISSSIKLEVASNGYLTKEVLLTGKNDVILVFLEPSNILMNEVQVTGLSTQRKSLNTPGTIGTITNRDFERNNSVFLQNTLNLVSGVRMEMRTVAGGTRIVMRGYGNQTNTNNGIGYKAYINDIPLTDADGSTTLDDVDFDNLGRVEVFKGPSSSIYGTGIGGVITMYNQKAPEGSTVLQSYLSGSDGLIRTNTTLGVGTDKTNLFVNYGHQEINGFRKHHTSKKDFLNINADIYNDEKRSFFVYASYTKTHDLLAGQLDSLNFLTHPDSADVDYVKNDAFSDIESARVGLTQEYKFSDNFSNKTTVFVASQTIDNPLNNSLTKTNKNKFGARSSFTWSTHFGNKPARFSFGNEVLKNVNYQKIYNQTNGVLGNLTSDYELKPIMWNYFAQLELQIDDKTSVTAGLSNNYVEYGIADLRSGTGYINKSGRKVFKPLATPRIVLAHKFGENNLTYVSYGDGYSPPNFNQVIITQLGKINEDVQAERGGNFEIGTKGNAFNKSFTYELAFFTVEINDKLISQSFAANTAAGTPFYTITTNAGNVRNNGFELTFNYALIPKKASFVKLFRPFLTYSYYNCKNGDYKSDNNNNNQTKDYSGLKATGVAPNLFNIGFDVETTLGFYLNATNMYTDKMPITLDNTSYSPAYDLLSVKLGFRNMNAGKKTNKWGVDIYAGLDNILGQRYSQFTFLNVAAVAGQLPKVFNPGSPYMTYYIGGALRYRF